LQTLYYIIDVFIFAASRKSGAYSFVELAGRLQTTIFFPVFTNQI